MEISNTVDLEAEVSENVHATVKRFIALAVRGLVPMFDKERKRFCYRLKRTTRGVVREGDSPRYTLITLMGLHKLEKAGTPSPIACKPVLESLLCDLSWVDNVGDFGLLLWACALIMPERLAQVERQISPATALRYRDAQDVRTMELAWFLTGLSYWASAYPEKIPQLREVAQETYAKLCGNQGASGFFAHLSTTATFMGGMRGRIGSFADQVYPIYAMSKFSRVFSVNNAAARALALGRILCETQGSQGQWWWHYDSRTGRVFSKYPVFSVHQHGMAPMTLLALGEATQTDFSPWIYKGLNWINGNNELGVDMENGSASVIWRCLERPAWKRYLRGAFQLPEGDNPKGHDLAILFECRPYELGWLLYAFAGRPS